MLAMTDIAGLPILGKLSFANNLVIFSMNSSTTIMDTMQIQPIKKKMLQLIDDVLSYKPPLRIDGQTTATATEGTMSG
jgi:hypothetical protein